MKAINVGIQYSAAGFRTVRNVSSDHLDGQSLSVVLKSVPECVSFDNHQESHTDTFFFLLD